MSRRSANFTAFPVLTQDSRGPQRVRFFTACSAHQIPCIGPLNQNLLTTSDYFIVPLHPDYFSAMALSSRAKVLPRWKAWPDTAYGIEALAKADYPFPKPHAFFIGAVIQK